MRLRNIRSSKYSKVRKRTNLLLIGQCSLRVRLLVGRNQFVRQQCFKEPFQFDLKPTGYLFNIEILAEPELSTYIISFDLNSQELLQVSQCTDLVLIQKFSFKFFQSLKILFSKQNGNIIYIEEDNKLSISIKIVST